jgi:hypothetical protein
MKVKGIVIAASLILSQGVAVAQSGDQGQQVAGAPLCEGRAELPDPCAAGIPEGAAAGGVALLLAAGAGAALGLGSGGGSPPGTTGTTSTTSTTPN